MYDADKKKMVTNAKEVQEVWKNAFEKLGNDEGDVKKYDSSFQQSIAHELKVIMKKEKEKKEMNENEEQREREEQDKCADLNREIELSEVIDIIRKLRNGKATGMDSISNEMLKHGGPSMWAAVWVLCQCAFKSEQVPSEWANGMIFPIFKDGETTDPLNYRGITLLSIVGKVYASVLNARLMGWSELNDTIVDEQCGFRPHRSCRDQMFALSETIKLRNNNKLPTFCCFIDLRKAYDRVFRDGLWVKLWSVGVQGKMWRALKNLYAVVQSAVLVNGKLTDWFDVQVGLRQGCVLSPILFDIFVNSLAEELKAKRYGVKFGMSALSILLFADDIVLCASSAEELQSMIKHVQEYCGKWRCDVNVKKTEVVVFGGTKRDQSHEFIMNGAALKQVPGYKYLGLDFYMGLRWSKTMKRLRDKARAKVSSALGMANTTGLLNVEYGVQIWKSLIRPVLEYGAELWGDCKWEDAERLQRLAAKRILRCPCLTTNEVALGELGWWSLKTRRDMLRLRFWAVLVNMSIGRIVKRVYNESRRDFESKFKRVIDMADPKLLTKYTIRPSGKQKEKMTNEEKKEIEVRKNQLQIMQDARTKNWCVSTYELLKYYELQA